MIATVTTHNDRVQFEFAGGMIVAYDDPELAQKRSSRQHPGRLPQAILSNLWKWIGSVELASLEPRSAAGWVVARFTDERQFQVSSLQNSHDETAMREWISNHLRLRLPGFSD